MASSDTSVSNKALIEIKKLSEKNIYHIVCKNQQDLLQDTPS